MKTVSLSGSLRENVGKKDAKNLRYQGKVPCVLYGGSEQVHFHADQASFKPILFTPETYLINITIDGKTYQAILKDVQYHPVGDQLLHADFYEVKNDKAAEVSLPVRLKGTAPGVQRGGKLKIKLARLTVKGLISDIPEAIVISVSKLNVGQTIKVKDLKFENISFVNDSNAVVVELKTARGVVATDEEDEATED